MQDFFVCRPLDDDAVQVFIEELCLSEIFCLSWLGSTCWHLCGAAVALYEVFNTHFTLTGNICKTRKKRREHF